MHSTEIRHCNQFEDGRIGNVRMVKKRTLNHRDPWRDNDNILIKTCQLERVVEVSTWGLPPGDHEEPRDPRFKKIAYLPASVRTPSPAWDIKINVPKRNTGKNLHELAFNPLERIQLEAIPDFGMNRKPMTTSYLEWRAQILEVRRGSDERKSVSLETECNKVLFKDLIL